MSSVKAPSFFKPKDPGVGEVMKGAPGGPGKPLSGGGGGGAAGRATPATPGVGGSKGGGNKRRSNDAEEFFSQALIDTRVRTARGEPVWAVFAVDNVLCRTYARTVAIAKAWDLKNGTNYFASLTPSTLGHDALTTCKRLKLSSRVTEAFIKHWDHVFWSESNYTVDTPIQRTLALVRAAASAGADIILLSGRVESMRDATVHQLKRLGLVPNTYSLFCRQSLQTSAPVFKTKQLMRWSSAGIHLAWYLSEHAKEVALIQAKLPQLTCVLLRTPVHPIPLEVRSDTPILFIDE